MPEMEDTLSYTPMHRLSFHALQKLLQQTRDEKYEKEKEMQFMVGNRYHDLLESADSIVTMHSNSKALEKIIQDMPIQWNLLMNTFPTICHSKAEEEIVTTTIGEENDPTDVASDEDILVMQLIRANEEIWTRLDRGDPLGAFLISSEMKMVTKEDMLIQHYPFVEKECKMIQEFDQRIIQNAKMCLQLQVEDTKFYHDALIVLTVTKEIQPDEIIPTFLNSRSDWIQHQIKIFNDERREDSDSIESQFLILFRSILDTVVHLSELFLITLDEPTCSSSAVVIPLSKYLNQENHPQHDQSPFVEWMERIVDDCLCPFVSKKLQDIDAVSTLVSLEHLLSDFCNQHYPQVASSALLKHLQKEQPTTIWRYCFEGEFTERAQTLFLSSFQQIFHNFQHRMDGIMKNPALVSVKTTYSESDRSQNETNSESIAHKHFQQLLLLNDIAKDFNHELQDLVDTAWTLKSFLSEETIQIKLKMYTIVMMIYLIHDLDQRQIQATQLDLMLCVQSSVFLEQGVPLFQSLIQTLDRTSEASISVDHSTENIRNTFESLTTSATSTRKAVGQGLIHFDTLMQFFKSQSGSSNWMAIDDIVLCFESHVHEFNADQFYLIHELWTSYSAASITPSTVRRIFHHMSIKYGTTWSQVELENTEFQEQAWTSIWNELEEKVATLSRKGVTESLQPSCALGHVLFLCNAVVNEIQPAFYSSDVIQASIHKVSQELIFRTLVQVHSTTLCACFRDQVIQKLYQLYQKHVEENEDVVGQMKHYYLLDWTLIDLALSSSASKGTDEKKHPPDLIQSFITSMQSRSTDTSESSQDQLASSIASSNVYQSRLLYSTFMRHNLGTFRYSRLASPNV